MFSFNYSLKNTLWKTTKHQISNLTGSWNGVFASFMKSNDSTNSYSSGCQWWLKSVISDLSSPVWLILWIIGAMNNRAVDWREWGRSAWFISVCFWKNTLIIQKDSDITGHCGRHVTDIIHQLCFKDLFSHPFMLFVTLWMQAKKQAMFN